MESAPAGKITYVSLAADDPVLNAAFDRGVADARGRLGRTWPLFIDGQQRTTTATFDSVSPSDTRIVVARLASATTEDVRDAVAAARAAFPTWSRTPWQERAARLEKAAVIIRSRRYELAAWMIFEMGKNRIEALGEIEETADLITYYNQQMRANDGYVRPMDRLNPTDDNTSVLRPYGVWAVIAPWNFPYALLGAPAAAALLTGNTVVMKPSSETPLSAVLMAEIFAEAGMPPGTVNCLTGSGRVVGDGLFRHPDVDGVTFTGSLDVGFNQIFRQFSTRFPKPCIVEMGGKNPAIVMDSADLDRAALGVFRSAFGMNGHKCSACSRLYVHEAVADELMTRLDRKIAETKIGDPFLKDTFLGPVATRASHQDFQRFVANVSGGGGGGAIRTGGRVLTEGAFAHGYFVQPTVVVDLARDHQLMRDELFVPILSVTRVKTLDQALGEANDTPFGLTAGIFSRKPEEIDAFLNRIEAGVVYVNRAAGATTGAWPGVQPFGGWKGSGSTGKNIGGLYTLPCYMREQSRTVCA